MASTSSIEVSGEFNVIADSTAALSLVHQLCGTVIEIDDSNKDATLGELLMKAKGHRCPMPEEVTREQIGAALKALGIPAPTSAVSWVGITAGEVTVEVHGTIWAGQRASHRASALYRIPVRG